MKRVARIVEQLKDADADAIGVAGVRAESHRLALEAQAPLLPPHDREPLNGAADALLTLLTVDAVDDLVAACRDDAVRVAVAALLGALAEACKRRPR